MLRTPNADRARMLRGIILNCLHVASQGQALYPDYSNKMGRDVLLMTLEKLASLTSNEELHATLNYLQGKQYIEVAWLNDGTGSFASIELLVAGIDLAEGTTQDPGVTFRLRR